MRVVGIFLTDGAFGFKFYDTGRVVPGWNGRFHKREVLYAKERYTDGVVRGPPEPKPKPDYDLSPARPEDWTLGGLRVGDMMIDQARSAQLPEDAGTKYTAMWTDYLRKTFPSAFVADAPMVQTPGQHAEMNAPEILRQALFKVASIPWLITYGC